MIPGETGFSVAVVGASSLLGREVRAVIKERRFPVARLIELEAGGGPDAEPELPVLDIEKDEAAEFLASQRSIAGIDLAFIAAPADPAQALLAAGLPRLVIDVDAGLAEPHREAPHIAFLDSAVEPGSSHGGRPDVGSGQDRGAGAPGASGATQVVASAHPATMVLSALLLRLGSKTRITTSAAQVLIPASHLGPRGIEELQKQTVNVLSFQKIPRAIFGAQLAFNVLPRLTGTGAQHLAKLESRVRAELEHYLAGRGPVPALRVLQAPVFFSLGVSLYVETAEPVTAAKAAQALAGEPLRVSRSSERAPSQVDVTGSAEILVDSITPDPGRSNGLWIWATADNLRLAADESVRLAESLLGVRRTAHANREPVH